LKKRKFFDKKPDLKFSASRLGADVLKKSR